MKSLAWSVAVVLAGCSGSSATPDGHRSDGGGDAPHVDAPIDAPPPICPAFDGSAGSAQDTIPPGMIVTGDVSLQAQSDVDALAGIREITGKLTIVSPTFTTLALPDLEVVGGEIELDDSAVAGLTSIAFPKLVSTGGDINLLSERATTLDLSDLVATGNGFELNAGGVTVLALPCLATTPNLTVAGAAVTLSLPSLVTAPQLTIANNPNLTAIDLPALTTTTSIAIEDDAALVSISLPVLASAGDFAVSNVVSLTAIDAPALGSAASVNISGTGLTALPLPALETVTHSFILSSDSSLVTLDGVSAITSIGALGVLDNASLTTLGLATLTHISDTSSEIEGNTALPTCQATMLATRLGATIAISGNDDAGTCP